MKVQKDLYLRAIGAKVKKAVGIREAVSVIIDVSYSQRVDLKDIISQAFHTCNESLNFPRLIPRGAVCVNKNV